jgi:hypothetical protein
VWLTRAARLFRTEPGRVRHAFFLTAGRRHPVPLVDAVRACAGTFSCDCRGLGMGWEFAELARIAAGPHDTVDIVADPEDPAGEPSDWRRTSSTPTCRRWPCACGPPPAPEPASGNSFPPGRSAASR